jgi:hypothetical protein
MDKYKLSDITKEWEGRILYRIQALRDFGLVKAGDLGGWVESEINLSQEGNCWIYNDAIVCDKARVKDDAYVFQSGIVKDEARVEDRARVWGYSVVCDNAVLRGDSQIDNNVRLYDRAIMTEGSSAWNNAEIGGEVEIGGKSVIYVDGFINSQSDIFWTCPFGINKYTLTAFRCKCGEVFVYVPFLSGYIEEFEQYVNRKMAKSPDKKLYKSIIEFIKANFGL